MQPDYFEVSHGLLVRSLDVLRGGELEEHLQAAALHRVGRLFVEGQLQQRELNRGLRHPSGPARRSTRPAGRRRRLEGRGGLHLAATD